MKFRCAAGNHRVVTIILVSIFAFLFALVPEQAFAKKHKGKRTHAGASLATMGAAHPASPKAHKARAKTGPKHAAGKRGNTSEPKAPRLTRKAKAEEKKICVAAYNEAKETAQSAHLAEAKELLGKCARPVCGHFLMQECKTLYDRFESDLSSAAPVVTDASVNRANSVSTSAAAGGIAEKAAEPETGRSETAKIAPDAEPEATEENRPAAHGLPARDVEPERERGSSWPKYALAGVGALGLGSAALFTTWGRKDNRDLMTSCAPLCPADSVHHIRMLYLAADVSLGVGIVALAASTWLFVRSPGADKEASTRAAHVTGLDIRTTSSGAFATLGGTF